MKKKILWLCVIIIAFLVIIPALSFFAPAPSSDQPLFPLILRAPDGQEITLQVEQATTDNERAYGLMNRTKIAHGMLFVFDADQPLVFWMKDTLVPLDILFFGHDGSFISSTTMQPCTADPCLRYPSAAPAQYALEMPEGFLKDHPVAKNWKLVR